MKLSILKIITASTLTFTGWHMGLDWLNSSNGKPFDPFEATQLRRNLLKIEWGQIGICSKYSMDYNSQTKHCGKRGPLYVRPYPSKASH